MLSFIPREGKTGRTWQKPVGETRDTGRNKQAKLNLAGCREAAKAELKGCRERRVFLSLADRTGLDS